MKRFSLATLALCLFAALAFAQSNTGRLVGTVSSPDGVIPGATVTVTDTQTGRVKTVVTSGEGNFSIPQLEVGSYSVTIGATGFKTFTATDVRIDIGKDYSLTPTLEVGAVTETVTVVAGADIINSTSGELSNTVSERQIKELPLNGRNPLNLIQLQAGTASNGATNTAINGQRTSFTNITRDGINIQDNFIRSNASTFAPERPSVDDVNEFVLTTQNAGADRGYGASQVQIATPRGRDKIHGALFEYNRNSKVAANDFFNNASGVPRPFLNRNQFGGSISGTLPSPRFGEGGPAVEHGKLFFFGYYEGLRLRTATPESRTILTPNALNGLFTFRDSTGTVRTANILQLAGLSGIDPTVQSRFLSRLPRVGNTTDFGDQLNTTGFNFAQQANTDRNSYTTRIDYDINSKNTINGVYSHKGENNLRPDVDNSQARGGGFGNTPITVQPSTNNFLALAYRTTPTASFTNEVRGGFFFSDPIFRSTATAPNFFVSLPLISSPEVNFQDQGRFTKNYNIQDNAEYTRGNHSFRFGGQGQFFRTNPFGPGAFGSSTVPTLTLGTNVNTPTLTTTSFASLLPAGATISSSQVTTANALLGLLGGFVTGASQTFNATTQTSGFVAGSAPSRRLFYENYSLYVSDQYRVRPNLTLNLGLRYEIYTGIREPNGLALEPVLNGRDVRTAVLDPNGTFNFVGTNVGGTKFFNSDKNNFAPVVSFAYTAQSKNKLLSSLLGNGKTVLRGGFRISYVNDEFVRAADNALGANAGLSQGGNAINSVTGTTQLNARLNAVPSVPTPAFSVPRTFLQNNLLAGRQGTAFAIDPNLQVSRTEEYNFTFEREVGFKTAVQISYVGGRSNNLVRSFDANQVDIFNNGFLADFNRARQNLILSGNRSAAFNSAIAGSQPLTVFPNLGVLSGTAGGLTNGTVINNLLNGTPADLATTFAINNLAGTVQFFPNPNILGADLLSNNAKYRYNALQAEVRRRFSGGLAFQANYTFQKTLTNASGVGQTNFEPILDQNNLALENSRADYDQTQVFNLNAQYELPFGKGKRFLNEGGVINRVFGGFQVTSIIRLGTGAPLTITDPRGTLNRAARSGRQTANSSLDKNQIKNLIGIRRTPCGVFFIDPAVINIDLAAGPNQCGSRVANASAGQAAIVGQPAFPGQVFFNAPAGQTGNMERAFINGPKIFRMDASIIKNIAITEGTRLQLRAEAFNVTNRVNFFISQFNGLNINSTNFGRAQFTVDDPRVIQFAARFEF